MKTSGKIVRMPSGADGAAGRSAPADAHGLSDETLLAMEEGPGHFDVRRIRVAPGGVSKDHAHPWEQANYVLSGTCRLLLDGAPHVLAQGDFAFIPGNVRHQFVNTGPEDLVLLAVRGPGPAA